MAQDDYYYEIQLTNKQLVFYFMAGAAGLILSFLAGVMVGRGVEGGTASASEPRAVAEDRVIGEPSPAIAAATPPPSDYSYPQRLGSDRPEEGLDRSRPGGTATPSATPRPGAAPVRPCGHRGSGCRHTHAPAADTSAARGHPAGRPGHRPPAQGTRLLLGGLLDPGGGFQGPGECRQHRAEPEGPRLARVRRGPGGGRRGLFTVRVGVYRDRADAEAVQERLRDEKFKPFVIKQ